MCKFPCKLRWLLQYRLFVCLFFSSFFLNPIPTMIKEKHHPNQILNTNLLTASCSHTRHAPKRSRAQFYSVFSVRTGERERDLMSSVNLAASRFTGTLTCVFERGLDRALKTEEFNYSDTNLHLYEEEGTRGRPAIGRYSAVGGVVRGRAELLAPP